MAECRVVFAQESRAALAAVSFLTRIPVPTRVALDAEDVRRAGAYFPLVGAGVGALTGALARRRGPAVALAVETLLTGALHLDALADSADSLGSRDRERALEIMRDSRIGSFGTTAVCLDLMVRAAALADCDDPVGASASAGALSRAVAVLLSAAMPYARPSGTGRAISGTGVARAGVAAVLALALSRDRGAATVTALVGVASAGFWSRKLGGITGDTLGASIELTDAAVLLWCSR